MSQENVEAARAFYEQFARGDFSAFAAQGDDFEYVTSAEVPDAGTYRGEAARRWMAAWVGSFDELTMEARDFTDAGDYVVYAVHQRGRLRDSQAVIEGEWWQVMTFRGGDLIRAETFRDRTDAFRAAGLRD